VVEAKMETQPSPTDEQMALEDLAALPLEELEELLLKIYASVEKTVDAMGSYAQGAAQFEAPSLRDSGLENRFQKKWEALKVTVDAIIYHAVFAEQNEMKR
jgi:hypothetical protein